MVLITFSLAQEDSKKMEKVYTGINSNTANRLLVHQSEHNYQASSPANQSSIPVQ
jgi:ribosomal protein S2